MLSLKESILKSNGADLVSVLRDIVRAPFTKKGKDKLNDIWSKLGLDLDGFEWQGTNIGTYIYVKKDKRDKIPFKLDSIILWAGNCYASDILVCQKNQEIGFSRKLSSVYCDAIVKKLGVEISTTNDNYYYLDFK